MPRWNHTLDITDFWRDDSMSLAEKNAALTTRIKTSRWFESIDDAYYIQETLDEMEEAAGDGDVEYWDFLWNDLYDVFDAERIWVKTI